MEVKINGTRHELIMEGPISEKTTLYSHDMRGATEILINMEKVTFINSIGVKNWINWTMKIPSMCKVRLAKCPFVIINQANIVHGFLPKHCTIESFIAPFACTSCGHEKLIDLTVGQEYQYKTATEPKFLKLPEEILCNKCGDFMEADFLIEKSFMFLNQTP